MKRLGCGGMVTETCRGGCSTIDLADVDRPISGWMVWDYKKFADWTWDNSGLFSNAENCTKGAFQCVDADEARKEARVYLCCNKVKAFPIQAAAP